MRNSPRFAIAALLIAACHSSAPRDGAPPEYTDDRGIDRAAVLLSDWRPTVPQKCMVSTYPEKLPTPESLIATADMPILLRQGGIAMARGTALISLKFDSTGHVQRARVIEGTIADDVAPMLEQVVLSAIEPQVPGRDWGVRLLVELDSVPRYRVGRSEHCNAVLSPTQAAASPLPAARVAGVVAVPAGGRPVETSIRPETRTISIRYLIALNARGEVVDVKQVGASSESASFLEAHREWIARQRWLPELDDRIPVETIVERTDRIQSFLAPAP